MYNCNNIYSNCSYRISSMEMLLESNNKWYRKCRINYNNRLVRIRGGSHNSNVNISNKQIHWDNRLED